jgi:hypothetical protein
MKKTLLFNLIVLLVFTFLLILPLTTATVSLSNSPEIKVTIVSQTPDPVQPGGIVKVRLKIENSGQQSGYDAIVKVIPKFPFTIYNDVAEKNIGKLRASTTGADAEVVEFKLKVDETAVEADTGLPLEIQIGASAISYIHDELLIRIQSRDALLDITSITSEPQQIAPGETAKVDIMVKNQASGLLRDIKFKLDFSSSTLPLAPYQSSSERRITLLESKYQNDLTFQIIAKPDATPGLYKIPLNISYTDQNGNSYSLSDVLALKVGEVPKLKAYIKKSTVLQSGKNGLLTIEIANAGTTNAKYVELLLLPSEDYQLVTTSNYFYLGNVDSDDTESQEINLYIKSGLDSLHFPVQLKYTDANNQVYQQEFDLELNLFSSSQLKKFGVVESSSAWGYLVLIVLIMGGAGFYKYYWKKKKSS